MMSEVVQFPMSRDNGQNFKINYTQILFKIMCRHWACNHRMPKDRKEDEGFKFSV